VIKRRPRLRLGWATGLLAAWATLEIVLFWRVAWRARNYLPDTSPALLTGFAITALYYFAGALMFPEDLDELQSLDDYFMQEKAKTIGALIAAAVISYAARPLVMGAASWSYMIWFDYLVLSCMPVAALVAIVTRRRRVAIGALALLLLFDVEHDQSRSLRSASLAFQAAADRLDLAGPAAADHLRPRERVGGGAARAFHAQRAAEANEIGGRADMLVGHSPAVAR
jgi:hypothetical protein